MNGAAGGGSWQDKRVLVTGAAGLLGSWLVKALLERGARVTGFDRDWPADSELVRSGAAARCTLVTGSVEDGAAFGRTLADSGSEAVFHLAAQTQVEDARRDPVATLETNVRGTWVVLEAARRGGAPRVVVASSDKAYGDSPSLPYDESMPTSGRHPYDVSKSCADLIARMYHATYALPVAVARCGNLYGGGDLNWGRIVPGTIRSLWRGERPVLRSDGTLRRDYLYIADAVEGYLLLAEGLARPDVGGECFNFGPSEPRTVLEVVDRLRALMGKRELEPLIRNTATAEIHDQYLSAEKAKRALGWIPRHGFEDGLKATIAWYETFLAGTR